MTTVIAFGLGMLVGGTFGVIMAGVLLASRDAPDTNVGDMISRQAAIDAINHICPIDTEYDCTLLDWKDVEYVLSNLPSANSEKAKWIYNNKHGTFKTFTCSKCGLNMETDGWKFCPNCGAKMEEDE